MASFQCRSCGTAVPYDEPIPRESTCERCGADLRACVSCRHYDPRYNNSCRETMADPVEDHARRNFCEYFSFTREPFAAATGAGARAAEARAKLDALFRKKPADEPTGEK
ncbi:MAG: hypothetical protein HZC42_01220 [Candidatus Eisenbacteria bacterium]|nr:hypothetical protein [Candidatus Eisenbacteria bacterium]